MIKRAATTIAKASVQPSDSQGFDSLLKLFIGEDGQNATFSFQQVDTGVFRKVVQTGAGGGTYPYFNNGGKSASLEYSVPAGILIGETGRLKYYGLFGGGSACANSFFNAGSQGLVIIYY